MMTGSIAVSAKGTCCALMKRKPSFKLSVGGLFLPGFPVTLEDLSSYVKSLLNNPSFKIMGQKTGPKSVLMDIDDPEQVDMILNSGGEINICDKYQPIVG